MGMTAMYLKVAEGELKAYQQNSQLLETRIYKDDISEDPDVLGIDKAWKYLYWTFKK